MPVQITVGPPVITINQGSTFMVTDQRGEIDPESEQGVFVGDTPFVSVYQLYTPLATSSTRFGALSMIQCHNAVPAASLLTAQEGFRPQSEPSAQTHP